MNYFCEFIEMPGWTLNISFPENDRGVVPEVWAGLFGVVGRQRRQAVAGRFGPGLQGAGAGAVSHPPLWRLCSWPAYAKALALSLLKSFSDLYIPLRSRFIVLQRICTVFS